MMWAMTESHSGLTLSGIIPSNISHSCNNTRNTCHKRDTRDRATWKKEGGMQAATSSHCPATFLTLSPTLQRPAAMSSSSSSAPTHSYQGHLGELRTEHRKL